MNWILLIITYSFFGTPIDIIERPMSSYDTCQIARKEMAGMKNISTACIPQDRRE